MRKVFLKSIFFVFLLLGSCYFLANQVFARTSSSWDKVGTSGMDSTVSALAIYNNELYAGGNFITADGIAVNYIAKWNGTSWSKVGSSGMNGTVYVLAVYNDELYASGSFITADGITVNRIAKWNGLSWSAVGSSGMNQPANSLVVYNNKLYAGGYFTTVDGMAVGYIAKWDGANWSKVSSTDMNARVNILAVYNNNLYAGGIFTTANGIPANRIAKWNDSEWFAVGTGMNSDVSDLVVYNNELYAGGAFDTAGGITANKIAKWNNTAWSAVGTHGLSSAYGPSVNALAVYNNELYAGGRFATVDDIAVDNIAKWNNSSWSIVGSGTSGVDPAVNILAVYNDALYAGGAFTTASGSSANYIASWYIDYLAPTTTASPAGGTHTSDQSVTLTATDTDSSVSATYYTIDGSTPTTSSTTYSAPISITQDTTLKFFSVDSLGNTEEVKMETYVIDRTIVAQRKLRQGKKIYLYSGLDGKQISGGSLVINFTDLPNKLTKNSKYWIQLIKYKSYPGSLALGSHLSLKKYWLLKTNLNKYKPKKSSKKFKIKIDYKYTQKELNVLKKIEPNLPTKDLKLKYRVKAGLNWYKINNQWTKTKAKHSLSKRKFTVKYFKKFPRNTYYFAIIKK